MSSPSVASIPTVREAPARLVMHNVSLARATGLGVGFALLAIHAIWRVDETLASPDSVGLTLSVVLFSIEIFIAAALLVGALSELIPAGLRIVPEAIPEAELPTIDLFVLIADAKHAPKAAYSLAAASQLDYPTDRVRLHLVGLEQATENEALAALAERTKASWLAASPEASAGSAVNAALSRTAGSLLLVLNAGEAPTPDLFRRVAGGFHNDPRLAFVDIPTFAIDGDPALADLDVAQRLPADPGHFLKSCLKTIAAASGCLGLGQRTVWRRASLAATGLCSRWNMRPDVLARIRAAESGWRRGLVTRPMVAAIAPDTVKDHLRHRLTQRIGTIDATLFHDPLLAKGMPARERLAWMPATLAAALPFAWALSFAIPPLALLLGIDLFGPVAPIEGLAFSLIAPVAALALAGALTAGMRDVVIAAWSEILESLLTAPTISTLVTRTDKVQRVPDPEAANGLLVVLFAVSLAGTTVGIARWFMRPELQPELTPVLALTIFGACLFACLLGAIAESRQRRLSPRVARRFGAELLLGGERHAGRLADISVHGAKFIAEHPVALSARALAGQLTLRTSDGVATLPVQLSRQSDARSNSCFGLSFTGRTVGEFATVVRLAHRSGDAYADLCDTRARPAGLARLFAASTWRGLWAIWQRFNPTKNTRTRWLPIRRLKYRSSH